ncbi:aminoglycoside phosphotransferase family protein [Agromyces sp. LHK192]|uniref:aminoglycoside phosphotransferase family protein n=1 Tax=Agromyces sp. LHK192 TaxID=2498704 RepID=UPI000FD708F8|nr:aminoglycoside phosphotransferase family protein [Agromyces sp. LHK192]
MSDLGPVSPGHRADAEWQRRWRLRPDGDPRTTASSALLPVTTRQGEPAMLKLSRVAEEQRGGVLLEALDGHGVARVLRRKGRAILIERATGMGDLVAMVAAGRDDEATRIVCETGALLHAASADVLALDDPPELVDLPTWFRQLFERADRLDPFHRRGADLAWTLLEAPRDEVVLHGDLHHGNVLDFGERGWLAIDPKALYGERAFDFANLLCNPSHERALRPGRLARQLDVVVATTGIDRGRMLDWLVAWCALSSTWFAIDGDPGHARSAVAIGELALALRAG